MAGQPHRVRKVYARRHLIQHRPKTLGTPAGGATEQRPQARFGASR
jgi:hypothetical protein